MPRRSRCGSMLHSAHPTPSRKVQRHQEERHDECRQSGREHRGFNAEFHAYQSTRARAERLSASLFEVLVPSGGAEELDLNRLQIEQTLHASQDRVVDLAVLAKVDQLLSLRIEQFALQLPIERR